MLEWPAPAVATSDDGPAPPVIEDRSEREGDIARIGPAPTRFEILPETSAIMIRARSNVGAIDFGTTGIRGMVEAAVSDSVLDPAAGVHGRLEVDVGELTSATRSTTPS